MTCINCTGHLTAPWNNVNPVEGFFNEIKVSYDSVDAFLFTGPYMPKKMIATFAGKVDVKKSVTNRRAIDGPI